MTTQAQTIAAVARRLGRRTNLDADILLEMDIVQQTVLERNGRIVPWFLPFTINSALPTVADTETITLPADFIGVPEQGGFFLNNSDGDWIKIVKGDYGHNLTKHQDETGFPEAYSIDSLYLRLRPIPDAVYSGRLAYKAKDALPSATASGSSNLWMTHFPDLLIYQTAQWCARDILQDFELATTFEGSLKAAWDRLLVETERREHEDREYNMGDAP